MGKRKNRKHGNKQSEMIRDREKDIELYAEALCLAMKKYDEEKKINADNINIYTKEKIEFGQVRAALRIAFLPFLSNKKIRTQGNIYIELLGGYGSFIIRLIGWGNWALGILGIIACFVFMHNIGILKAIIFIFMGISLIVIGGSTVLAGRKFGEETDSTNIFAYMSNVFALLSFILAIISLFISGR